MSRVYITGCGLLTAAGHSQADTWQSLIQGESHLGPVQSADLTDWPCQLGGELRNFNPAPLLPDRKLMKAISKQDAWGLVAASMAIEQSDLLTYRSTLTDPTTWNDRTGVYVGSPGNKYLQQYDFLPLLAKTGGHLPAFADQLFSEVHPMWLLRILPNNVLAYTGILYGFKGPNHNIANHAVSGMQALIEAYHAIHAGQIDRAVVVAYDLGLDPQSLFYYEKLGLLSPDGLKPFDAQHNGTVLADGAAALILESERSVAERQGTRLAEFLGGSSLAEDASLFSLESSPKTLNTLLANTVEKHVQPQDLAFIVAHGNGNKSSDNSEAAVLAAYCEQYQCPVTAFKWCMGHTLTASGLVDTILAVNALQQQVIPGIATHEAPAAAAKSLNIAAQTRPLEKGHTALIINRGFAAMNACVAIKACDA